MNNDSILERVEALESCTTEMADVLMGSRRTELEGGGRKPDGIVQAVERIETMVGNGGIRTKLVPRDRVALWVAVIGVLGLIIESVILALL